VLALMQVRTTNMDEQEYDEYLDLVDSMTGMFDV
jgi:hypothetical protein